MKMSALLQFKCTLCEMKFRQPCFQLWRCYRWFRRKKLPNNNNITILVFPMNVIQWKNYCILQHHMIFVSCVCLVTIQSIAIVLFIKMSGWNGVCLKDSIHFQIGITNTKITTFFSVSTSFTIMKNLYCNSNHMFNTLGMEFNFNIGFSKWSNKFSISMPVSVMEITIFNFSGGCSSI